MSKKSFSEIEDIYKNIMANLESLINATKDQPQYDKISNKIDEIKEYASQISQLLEDDPNNFGMKEYAYPTPETLTDILKIIEKIIGLLDEVLALSKETIKRNPGVSIMTGNDVEHWTNCIIDMLKKEKDCINEQ